MTVTSSQSICCCPIVELRQYTLHPGTRETLIELFEREFVESQEEVGILLLAQFRDIDRPDVFTWLRGFPSMPARSAALSAFYDGPVWARHRDAANATMLTWDNVRLLRPVSPRSGISVTRERRGAAVSTGGPEIVAVTIYTLVPSAAESFARWFDAMMKPQLILSGARPIAVLESESSPNTFPRLPIREGEHAFVWIARFTDLAAHRRHVTALAGTPRWSAEIKPELDRCLTAEPELWRLTETARSRTLL
jgi:quinol monooxygenase YgiN